MSRPMRIFRNVGIALVVLIVVLGIAAILLVQSAWFQNYLKQTIITTTEDSTGGKAEIGTFHFEWRHLTAVATDFVIHGTEPAGTAPLVRVARVQLNLRLFTSIHHLWDITYLGLDHPQANVIVYPDGRTNIPSPRTPSSTSPLETVVDLAIRRFELTNGLVNLAAHRHELNVRGNNLRAQISYNILKEEYRGQVSLQPIYVVSGRNTPVNFTVNLPLELSRNRIDVHDASIASSASAITISALIEDLRNPKLSGHATGHIALADLKNAADVPLSLKGKNVPSMIDLDANASTANNSIEVAGLRLSLGHSNIQASGSLNAGLNFNGRLALGELGRLANTTTLPDDTASLNGTARLESQNNLTLTGLRASAFGAEFAGYASLKDFTTYQVRGDLRHLDLESAIRAAGQTRLPYDGVLSGPINIAGNLNTGLRSLTAQAKVSVKPGSRGIPLSGNLTAAYSGAKDDVSIQKSLLTLPHTRLSVDGSVRMQLNVALTTTNLDDLFAAVPQDSRPPVALHGGQAVGQASFTGKITGSLTAPSVSGHVTASRFIVEGRQFDSFNADASVTKRQVAIENGRLGRNMMQARFSGTLGLRDWKALPTAPLAINASIQNGDLADLLALAGQPSSGYSGQLNANVNVNGTLGDPTGTGSLVVTGGMIRGQPIDRAEAQVNLTDQLVTVPSAFVQLGSARLNLTGQFQHPRDSFTMGQLRADLQSNQIDLAQLNAIQKERPKTAGTIQVHASVAANLSGQIQLTNIDGNASVSGLQSEGQNYGDFTATATTSGQTVNYNLTSNFAGSNIHIDGSTQLTHDYPTTARANLGNLPVQRVLAVADRKDIPIKGLLSGTANFSGTIDNPQGSADLTLANGTIYDDAVSRVHARLNYQSQTIDLPQLEVVSGSSRLDLTAHYDHPAGNFESGNLQFRLDTSSIDLAHIKTPVEERPGLGGTLQVNVSGAAQVRATEPRILVRDVSGNIKTTGLALNGNDLGDLTLTANTQGGRTNFTLNSGMAGASIEGRGSVQLTNEYPTDAQVTFKNMAWSRLGPLLGYDAREGRGFEAAGDGQVSVNGPLLNTRQLRGSVQVTRLEVSGASSVFRKGNTMLIHNQGPISATLDHASLQIQSAHLIGSGPAGSGGAGSQTDLQATGTVPLNGQDMSIALNGNVNLAILQQFDRFITSSGNIVLAAGVRGPLAKPRLTGQVELHNASFDYAGLPTGVWKANGVVALNGDSAVIRSLSAEAGGGQVSVTGSATLTSTLRFGLQAKANRVRVVVQEGVGVVASANISLSGTTENSVISGTVTVDQVSYASRTDLGSILSLAAPPVQAPSSAPLPLFENMRLDVRVRSSSALGVQSSLAQNLELTADLRVRGTVAYPGVLGRVLITEGKLVFFGSTYTVNTGTIAFYNPVRIEPILDLSLETQTQGVDVVLKVTGPIDNMKLSYTSDPPLQFQEIVSLLATGNTPTSDPTILANSPALGPQSFQEMGESAVVGRALADPVTNQLQRVFGVTQLKINPAFTAGSQLPEAQLSLQQQVSNNLTFTYVSGLNTANAETIQAVWTFTPIWSAQALLDYNGILSVTLIYKKQFR
jgi:translocation and assembly module TamB